MTDMERYLKQCREFAEALDEEGMDRDGLHIAIHRVCDELERLQKKSVDDSWALNPERMGR